MEDCTERTVHPEQVAAARSALTAAPVEALAETFRTLGDPTRVGILLALADRELCGCDLAELFGVTPSAISHQLRLLKAHRLVRARREGKLVYYGLDDEHVHTLFAEGRKHVEERS
ncbi:MAG TPA: metalloregulator ArsR/SmtB family transcription factor [Deferrisomatales bacterium]|nr:metalloregulator ArsR/SmtB family transcription factor [Deferrisomatales bacterium]